MPYTGINQTSVTNDPVKALVGQFADNGPRDVISIPASAAVDAGRVLVGTSTCAHPSSAASLQTTMLGISVYEPLKEPETTDARFAAGDMVPIARAGRVWARAKVATLPTRGAPVYVYIGATTADRGMVSAVAAADYVQVPGLAFTGKTETTGDDVFEIQIGDMVPRDIQIVTGTLVAGVANVTARVTSQSRAVPIPSAAITGSVNFASLAHIKASDVLGAAGTLRISALGSDGAVDTDAAGTFFAVVFD